MIKNKMLKKATHNSATGEDCDGLISWLLSPFYRCQDKTIAQQYKEGVRLFDITIKKKEGIYRIVNGPLMVKKTFYEICEELNELCRLSTGTVSIIVNYDGIIKDYDKERIITEIRNIVKEFGFIVLHEIESTELKDTLWHDKDNPIIYTIDYNYNDGDYIDYFLPFPKLVDYLFFSDKEFNEDVYNMVDFI